MESFFQMIIIRSLFPQTKFHKLFFQIFKVILLRLDPLLISIAEIKLIYRKMLCNFGIQHFPIRFIGKCYNQEIAIAVVEKKLSSIQENALDYSSNMIHFFKWCRQHHYFFEDENLRQQILRCIGIGIWNKSQFVNFLNS